MEPVPDKRRCVLDANMGQFSVWGAVDPAIKIGADHREPGGVHVHLRVAPDAPKDVDGSFDIVTIVSGGAEVVVESMAAVAFSISAMLGQPVVALQCPKPHCKGSHIDEQTFATSGHVKHLCNSCGRNFWAAEPSISNPLAAAYDILGLERPPAPVRVDKPLHLNSAAYSSISIWPSNPAIVTNTTEPEDEGIHVHTWNLAGEPEDDDTYWPVFLDGEQLDLDALRMLAVQRSLSHGTPIVSLACGSCGTGLTSPDSGLLRPTTTHLCRACGATTKTARQVFTNPLAEPPRDR